MGPDFSGAFKLANLFAGGGSARGHDAFIEGQTAASRVQQALAQALANRELARSRRIQNDAVSSFPALFANAPSFFGGDETLRSEIGPLFAAIAQGNPDIDPRRLAETLALTERFNQQRRLLSDIEAGTFDPNRANSISQVFADEPVDLTKIAGNTAFNPLVTPDQNDFLTTEVGQSVIDRNEAAAEKSRRLPADGLTVAQATSLVREFSRIRPDQLTDFQRALLAAAEDVVGEAAGLGQGLGAIVDQTPSNAALGTLANPARPITQADFDALPSGAIFIDPEDGALLRKP